MDFLAITKIAPSKAEARRLVQQGGIQIHDKRIDDTNFLVTISEFESGKGCLVKKGKKSYFRVKIV